MSLCRSIARCFLAALVLAAGNLAQAVENLEDPVHNPGFIHFFNNEYDEALAFFEEAAKTNPDDPNQYNHIAQTLLYRELFRSGALESELVSGNNTFLQRPKLGMTAESREQFKTSIKKALELSE